MLHASNVRESGALARRSNAGLSVAKRAALRGRPTAARAPPRAELAHGRRGGENAGGSAVGDLVRLQLEPGFGFAKTAAGRPAQPRGVLVASAAPLALARMVPL